MEWESLFDGFEPAAWDRCPQCLSTSTGSHVYALVLLRNEVGSLFYVWETYYLIRRVPSGLGLPLALR